MVDGKCRRRGRLSAEGYRVEENQRSTVDLEQDVVEGQAIQIEPPTVSKSSAPVMVATIAGTEI